jgi:hypothetical protein
MRRRRLKSLWKRLQELQGQQLERDQLLLNLGAAKAEAGRAYGLVEVQVPKPEQPVNAETFTFRWRKDKLRQAMRREGRYLLRSNLPRRRPGPAVATLRAAHRDRSGLSRPEKRSGDPAHLSPEGLAHRSAHLRILLGLLFVHHLGAALADSGAGTTPRAVLEKMAAIQMVDVWVPTTDGRLLILPRYTQPEKDHQMLLHQLHLQLPSQPSPRIVSQRAETVA